MEQEQVKQKNSVWAEIEPYCVLQMIWKNLWMVVMAAGLALMAAYLIVTLAFKPRFSCSATFAVTTRTGANTASFANSTAEQFASLLSSSTLLDRVSDDTGISREAVSVSAAPIKDTNLINLTVTSGSPKAAYATASGILAHYSDYSQYVFNSVVLKPVRVPDVPTAKGYAATRRKVMLVAAPAGALLMAAGLAVLSILSGTVQTTVGAKNQVDGELLCTIGHEGKRRSLRMLLGRKKTSLLISNPTTSFGYVEAINRIAAHAEHRKHKEGSKLFLVTSVSENEGKSTVAANLALALARRHKKVLLVDCDLRKPAQHLIFDHKLDAQKTLNTLLQAQLDPDTLVQALHYRKNDNLFCLFTGSVRRRAAELQGSAQLRQLLAILRRNFDYVVLDSPPLGYFSDSAQLADLADASLLVVRQDGVTALAVNDAIDTLTGCKAAFLGYVLNDLYRLKLLRGSYGYGYGYGSKYGYSAKYGYGYGKTSGDVVSADMPEETEADHGKD